MATTKTISTTAVPTSPPRSVYGKLEPIQLHDGATNMCRAEHTHSFNWLHLAAILVERIILPFVHKSVPPHPHRQHIESDVRTLEIMTGGTVAMDYDGCYRYCRKFGMHLLVPQSHAENHILTLLTGSVGDFYLGVARHPKMGWVDITRRTNLNFTAWGFGQPNNARGHENVVKIRCDSLWNDIHESALLHPVCGRTIQTTAIESVANCHFSTKSAAYTCANPAAVTDEDLRLAIRSDKNKNTKVLNPVPLRRPSGRGYTVNERVRKAWDLLSAANGQPELLTQFTFRPCLAAHVNALNEIDKAGPGAPFNWAKNSPRGHKRGAKLGRSRRITHKVDDRLYLAIALDMMHTCMMPLTPLRRELLKVPLAMLTHRLERHSVQVALVRLATAEINQHALRIDPELENRRVKSMMDKLVSDLQGSLWAKAMKQLEVNYPKWSTLMQSTVNELNAQDRQLFKYARELVNTEYEMDQDEKAILGRALAFLGGARSPIKFELANLN